MHVRLISFFVVLILSLPVGSHRAEGALYLSGSGPLITSVQDFRGWLLVTSDPDWRQEWNDPSGDVPRFKQTESVRLGEEVTVLTLYSNPSTDEKGHIDIICDIRIRRPDGIFSYEKDAVVCGDGELAGEPSTVRLAYAVISYSGERGDPCGWWQVEVRLKDGNTGIDIILETAFELVNEAQMALAEGGPAGVP